MPTYRTVDDSSELCPQASSPRTTKQPVPSARVFTGPLMPLHGDAHHCTGVAQCGPSAEAVGPCRQKTSMLFSWQAASIESAALAVSHSDDKNPSVQSVR